MNILAFINFFFSSRLTWKHVSTGLLIKLYVFIIIHWFLCLESIMVVLNLWFDVGGRYTQLLLYERKNEQKCRMDRKMVFFFLHFTWVIVRNVFMTNSFYDIAIRTFDEIKLSTEMLLIFEIPLSVLVDNILSLDRKSLNFEWCCSFNPEFLR